MRRPRYALAMILPDGGRWLAARGPSRGGPLRTADPSNAETWESPEAVQEWLDSIPDSIPTRTGPVAGGRRWMEGVTFRAIPCVTTLNPGEAVPMKGSAGNLEGVTG